MRCISSLTQIMEVIEVDQLEETNKGLRWTTLKRQIVKVIEVDHVKDTNSDGH